MIYVFYFWYSACAVPTIISFDFPLVFPPPHFLHALSRLLLRVSEPSVCLSSNDGSLRPLSDLSTETSVSLSSHQLSHFLFWSSLSLLACVTGAFLLLSACLFPNLIRFTTHCHAIAVILLFYRALSLFSLSLPPYAFTSLVILNINIRISIVV